MSSVIAATGYGCLVSVDCRPPSRFQATQTALTMTVQGNLVISEKMSDSMVLGTLVRDMARSEPSKNNCRSTWEKQQTTTNQQLNAERIAFVGFSFFNFWGLYYMPKKIACAFVRLHLDCRRTRTWLTTQQNQQISRIESDTFKEKGICSLEFVLVDHCIQDCESGAS